MNRWQILIFIYFEMLKKALKAYKMFLYGGRNMQTKKESIREEIRKAAQKEFQYVLDERLLILFELRTARFIEAREAFVKKFKNHMAWHLGMEDSDSPYIDILTSTFVSCIRHVLLEHKDSEDAQKSSSRCLRCCAQGWP